MPNTVSAPGTPDDPCEGADPTVCNPTTHMAVTMCTSEGRWATADGANCDCVPKGGASTPNCGNGRLDTGEKCDTRLAIPANTTCMSMNLGNTGMVKCSSSCQFDTSMCSMGMGGMGGM